MHSSSVPTHGQRTSSPSAMRRTCIAEYSILRAWPAAVHAQMHCVVSDQLSIWKNTDAAVPFKLRRSGRSLVYCEKRAINHRQTQSGTSALKILGICVRRNSSTWAPRPQPAVMNIPCRTPWSPCRATAPLSTCTHRAATARPRPQLRARRSKMKSSPHLSVGLRQRKLQRQLRAVPKEHKGPFGRTCTLPFKPAKS